MEENILLNFPKSTEFNKRIPKQKFYENIAVTPAMKRAFVEQIRIIYWRNKIATTTLNLAAGEQVTEIEVVEVRLSAPELDESVLRQIDREIPYHILFLLACFDHDVTGETVKAIAQMKPYYAVFRDSSMANDSVATNFDQIFETYSPETVRKVL